MAPDILFATDSLLRLLHSLDPDIQSQYQGLFRCWQASKHGLVPDK